MLKILFVSNKNAVRSQMAEGFAHNFFQGKAEVASAGVRPSGSIHSLATVAMKEAGIRISSQHPKDITALPQKFLSELNVAILFGEVPSNLLSSKISTIIWKIEDPAHGSMDLKQLEAFRKVRDEIKTKVEALGKLKKIL